MVGRVEGRSNLYHGPHLARGGQPGGVDRATLDLGHVSEGVGDRR